MTTKHSEQPEPFKLKLLKPFTTFTADGKPAKIPFIVDGLLPSGSLSLLAGKPKQGKSSLTRHLAQCVSQGVPFLGRNTEKGEVLIISMEDPLSHVDNHLKVLAWNPETDSSIHIVTRLAVTPEESLQAIEREIKANPNLKLIIADTLQKVIQVEDMNDFAKVGPRIARLHQMVKDNPMVHFLGLIHCKKTVTEDVFDSMLGSTAFRAESATNIALFEQDGRRYIAAETRIGKQIPSTVIDARVVQLDVDIAADYVKGYHLGETLESNKAAIAERAEKKAKHTIEDRIFALIQEKGSATHAELAKVRGNMQKKLNTIERLVESRVLLVSGEKGSQANPLTYSINGTMHSMYVIGRNSTEVEVYAA